MKWLPLLLLLTGCATRSFPLNPKAGDEVRMDCNTCVYYDDGEWRCRMKYCHTNDDYGLNNPDPEQDKDCADCTEKK